MSCTRPSKELEGCSQYREHHEPRHRGSLDVVQWVEMHGQRPLWEVHTLIMCAGWAMSGQSRGHGANPMRMGSSRGTWVRAWTLEPDSKPQLCLFLAV